MKQTVVLFTCLGFLSANGQVNIDSCQSWAKTNYPLIKQYDLIEKSTEYTLSNANKAYLPQINLTAIAGYLFTSAQDKAQLIGIAQVNQTIWDGGATKAQKEIVQANADVEKSNVDVSFYSIREHVNQIYFG